MGSNVSYVYSQNGAAFVWHDASENYQPAPGEVDMGNEVATPEQLALAFPGYADVLRQRHNAAINAQIDAIFDANPITPRAQTETLGAQNQAFVAIATVLAAAVPASAATMNQIIALATAQNVKIAPVLTQVAALRQQLQPPG